MFIIKAALITNHPELGIRSQPYSIAANLEAIAMQLSLLRGRPVKMRDLHWGVHGNAVFVSLPGESETFHFTGCNEHQVEFTGPTFLFYSPMVKQYEAKTLSRTGVFHHIVQDLAHPDDADMLQTLFRPGRGNTQLPRATEPLAVVDEVSRDGPPPDAASGAGGDFPTGEKFGEGDTMTELFDGLSEAGFDVKLIEHDGEILGLAAVGQPMVERELVEDPGFWADAPQRGHTIKVGLIAEVSFDPIHFPSPASFMAAAAAAYGRLLHLNVNAEHVEPEVGMVLAEELDEFVQLIAKHRRAEPAYGALESPMLAKLPDEPGGFGRDSLSQEKRK